MLVRNTVSLLLVCAGGLLGWGTTRAEEVVEAAEAVVIQQSVPTVGVVAEPVDDEALDIAALALGQREGESQFAAPIRWAKASVRQIQANVQDYSCTIVKRECINGRLGREEVIFAKVRHEPFSVYLRFESPRRFRGREVIYVEGENNGLLLAHGTGLEAVAGTLALDPTGRQAMRGNLHPITDTGILQMAQKLHQTAQQNLDRKSFSVAYRNCEEDGVECVCVEVLNSDREVDPMFHKAHVMVDAQRNFPVRYVSWGWPSQSCEPLPLMEEYSYKNVQTNLGFTDMDFSVLNPEYNFRESRTEQPGR